MVAANKNSKNHENDVNLKSKARYRVQMLFPFIGFGPTKPKGAVMVSKDERGYRYIETRVFLSFDALKMRERESYYEFLTEEKKIVQVSKQHCKIQDLKPKPEKLNQKETQKWNK